MSENQMIWPTLNYADAPAAIDFLGRAFGFTAALVVPAGDTDAIAHAQLRNGEGAGVMLASANREGNVFSQRPVGAGSIYVVTEKLEELFEQAVEAGAEVIAELVQDEHGRGFSVTDPEGNIWSFGDYPGEPA